MEPAVAAAGALSASERSLAHVRVLPSGLAIWKAALPFLRSKDFQNLQTLVSFETRRLPHKIGGYTARIPNRKLSRITMNTRVGALPVLLQASLVAHEGRHVWQLAEGTTEGPTVQAELDALAYERGFLVRWVRSPVAVRRMADIDRQIEHLSTQRPDALPDLEKALSDEETEFVSGTVGGLFVGTEMEKDFVSDVTDDGSLVGRIRVTPTATLKPTSGISYEVANTKVPAEQTRSGLKNLVAISIRTPEDAKRTGRDILSMVSSYWSTRGGVQVGPVREA